MLDVGSGTGSFVQKVAAHPDVRVVGCDLSPAALDALRALPGVEAHHADAAELPFADHAFDIVTARHMLYHVPEPDRAIAEARRVLTPDGAFVATVNLHGSTARCAALVRDSMVGAGVEPVTGDPRHVHGDNVEELVSASFGEIEVHRYDNALVFPGPAPLVAFAASLLAFYGLAPDAPQSGAVVETMMRLATAWFVDNETWRDPKGYVVCVARH